MILAVHRGGILLKILPNSADDTNLKRWKIFILEKKKKIENAIIG